MVGEVTMVVMHALIQLYEAIKDPNEAKRSFFA